MPVSPIRLSGRFASVDVATLGEYMCRRHMAHTEKSMALCKHSHARFCIRTCFACARLGETRKKGRWTATFVTAHLGEGILLLMGRRSREFRPVS